MRSSRPVFLAAAIVAACSNTTSAPPPASDGGVAPTPPASDSGADATPPASDSGADATPPASDSGVAPTFTNVYAVITARCTPCHTTPTGIGVVQGGLDMTSRATALANLVGKPAAGIACAGKGTRVTPGQPDASIFYLKVSLDDPSPCGSKMPLTGGPLAKSETDLFEAWITAGAKDD
jgi:hypothetical protein